MSILFITKYFNGEVAYLQKEFQIVLIPVFAVFVAMLIDLLFGIRKAKELGEARTSIGFRRTVSKFIEYYSMLILAFVIDVLASIIPDYNLPYLTFLAAIYLVFCEIVSIREKASEKVHRRQQNDLRVLKILLENKDNIFKSFSEIINLQIEKEKEENNETN